MSNPFLDEPQSNTNPFESDTLPSTSNNPFSDPSDSITNNTNPFVTNDKPTVSKSPKVSSTNPFGESTTTHNTNPFLTDDIPTQSKSPRSKPISSNPFIDSEPSLENNNPFLTNDTPVPAKSPKTVSRSENNTVSTNPFGEPTTPQIDSTNPFLTNDKPTVSKSPRTIMQVNSNKPFKDSSSTIEDSTNPFGDSSTLDNIKTEATQTQESHSSKTASFTNTQFEDQPPKMTSSTTRLSSGNPFGESASTYSNPFESSEILVKSKTPNPSSTNPFGDEPPKLTSSTSKQGLTKSFKDQPPRISITPKPTSNNPFGEPNSSINNNPFGQPETAPSIKGTRPSFPKPKAIGNQIQGIDIDEIENSWLDKSTHDISYRGITIKSICAAKGTVLILGKEKHFLLKKLTFNLIKDISEHNIIKGAIDPTGNHLLLYTLNGELYYTSKDLISATKIKIPNLTDGTANDIITAIKFNSNSTSNEKELKVLLSTLNRVIIKLVIDLNTFKSNSEILYANNNKISGEMAPFNGLDWIETPVNTIILASSSTCLQKIVINKNKKIAKDETILIMPLKTDPETGYFSLMRDVEINNKFNVLWVSGKMKGIDPVNPAQSSSIVSRIVFELRGNELIQISKKDNIKDVVMACQTQNHIFYLYNDHLECYSLIHDQRCEEQLEGGAITMCADITAEEETLFVATEFCLYQFTVPLNYGKEDEPFTKKLIKDIVDENKLYRTLFKQLNEESQIKGKKISCAVLYCWCVSLLLEKLNNTEKVSNVFNQMKVLFSKEFDGVDKINTQIVRYMVRSCGSEEAYSTYCDCTRDYEGKVSWLMERSMYEEAFKFLKNLCMNKRDKDIGEELMKKYFGILFIKLPQEFIEFLEERDTSNYPIFYSTLLIYEDQTFSLKFANQLLSKKEIVKKHGSDKALVEFIFWKYVEPESIVEDDIIKTFLEEKEHWKLVEYDSALRALKNKEMTRSSMFMNLQKQRFEAAIDDGIKLLQTYNYEDKMDRFEEDVSLLLKLPSKIKGEDEKQYYYLKAMNGYLSLITSSSEHEAIKRKKIYETITKNKIPIEEILPLLPLDWELGEFKGVIKNAVDTQDKKQKRLNNEIETSCGSSALFENSTARHKKYFKTELNLLRCNFCGEPIFNQFKNGSIDQSRGAMFPCSHCFHILCIKKEFAQHPTPFARSVTQSIMFAKDEEEQFNCYATECPICGEHSVNLIEYPYTSTRDDQYWNL
ncbi:hypothetical protein EHI8A_172700 [Entamoeba histolytica HM-1:IMSS-B]|uniref:Pep3/Vps18 beta-propeller domain-containing protein n=6 Tax=Entamoeba histolytica TaxID=5759 RepID=C4M5P4_ENTH1|nr:hypothetical protein EHI_040650 [Entamoeba histolytica HM-1:IMSS]EMD46104.1 Hypothetical protein EHI5A_079700 [Entamoeba histolytica KU27]EMH75991.1 hypothetical protein EHI8A_172700 [Entamoeba histolytica HM-1:IMSS-B]EMS15568.1 hypothetical protein KM1_243280 [Entamoeba histolytica HM-3:IMSS]ENY62614.1 hypothetical protein EHI7A_046160 [Entamoeba histolytica HM-1:IMSS-A]GAT96753.1 hypothetical protein CL6EHI_040650 [Entamoeba histolytica]|eukprot:XP_651464.1 hypothetical protein EHI_040650 [Entamoeba histolytica HM-1:IMSS]